VGNGVHGRRSVRSLEGAVEGEEVEFVIEGGVELLAGIDGKKIGEETSSVRRGHRGARDCVGRAVAPDPGGEDVQA
jgi:hypothetical protein